MEEGRGRGHQHKLLWREKVLIFLPGLQLVTIDQPQGWHNLAVGINHRLVLFVRADFYVRTWDVETSIALMGGKCNLTILLKVLPR